MPQKKNPDVLELLRGKASKVLTSFIGVYDVVKGSPSGYNRDVQECKAYLLEGLAVTRSCLTILEPLVKGLKVNKRALIQAFSPDVFATDKVLDLVVKGEPFRDVYHYVKQHLDECEEVNPHVAIAKKTHLGGTAGLRYELYDEQMDELSTRVQRARRAYHKKITRLLLSTPYPLRI